MKLIKKKIILIYFILLFFQKNIKCFKSLNEIKEKLKKGKEVTLEKYPEVHVHMELPTHDIKEMLKNLKQKEYERHMIKDFEDKLNIDKQIFQQISNKQNMEIQKLSEVIKMNNYYTMKKVLNTSNNNTPFINKEKEDFDKFEKNMNLATDPFNFVQNENFLNEINTKYDSPKDIIDQIYQ